ncbi:MAG: LytTR family DNA-binding domain-containing protein [Eggerthellaceae bacterium]
MYTAAILSADSKDVRAIEEFVKSNPRKEAFEVMPFFSPSDLADYLTEGNVVSVLFIDAWMGSADTPAGVEFVQSNRPRLARTQIVYIAESGRYTSSIYETSHCYFLEAPFAQEGIDRALGLALSRLAEHTRACIPLKIGTTVRLLKYADIAYVESLRRKLRIHAVNEVIDVYGSLAYAASVLPDQFVQCHKSFIVNLDYVSELNKSAFVMASGEEVPVSQTKRKDSRSALLRYLAVKV